MTQVNAPGPGNVGWPDQSKPKEPPKKPEGNTPNNGWGSPIGLT